MKRAPHRIARPGNQDGQALVLFTLFLLVLILFTGLGIDLGFAYVTKAQLSKAVDAAALAGVSNYQQANPNVAISNAVNTFYANYATNGLTGRAVSNVVPTVTFSLDANSNRTISVHASATINTYFLRALAVLGDPQWKTLTVGDSAQGTRSRVVMTLVLDTSNSMAPDCMGDYCSQGGKYLPDAMTQFINVFDDQVDRAAVVSFGTLPMVTSPALSMPMSQPFVTKVTAIASLLKVANNYDGYTFSHGGLTNALAINKAVNDPTAIKVVVFFTDGQPNAIQTFVPNNAAKTPCNNGTSNVWIVAGFDSDSLNMPPQALFFVPANIVGQQTSAQCTTQSGCCTGQTTPLYKFLSIDGTLKAYNEDDVVAESTNRCIQVARQMRASSNYVYAVGLDTGNVGAPALDLLQQIANDPKSSTFTNAYAGAALISRGSDLTQVFQQIASDIILRLIQ